MHQNELSYKILVKMAKALGWRKVSQTGSHAKYRHTLHSYYVSIPVGSSSAVGKGLSSKIVKELQGLKL